MKIRRRVPFKPQYADSDCGAACIAMILAHFGQEVSVHTVRRLCEEHGPPESTRSMIRAARARGLSANLLASDLDGLAAVALPCILYWNFNHFVVLERVSRDRYLIADPSLGRRWVTRDEFSKSFTGVLISTERGPTFQTLAPEINTRFRSFLKSVFLQKYVLTRLAMLLLITAAFQAFSLIMPLGSMYLIDAVAGTGLREAMPIMLGAIVLLMLNVALMSVVRARIITAVQTTLDGELLKGYVGHMLSLPLRYFTERTTGEIQSRMNSNTVIREMMSAQTVSGLLDVTLGLGYLLMLASASWGLAGTTLLLALVQMAVILGAAPWLGEKIRTETRAQSQHQSLAGEMFNGIAVIRGSGTEAPIMRRWRQRLENYLAAHRNRNLADSLPTGIVTAVRMFAPLLLLWSTCLLYLDGDITMGQVVAFHSIAVMALTPLSSLIGSARKIQMLRTHMERIGDAWMHEPEARGKGTCPTFSSEGAIEFQGVSFRYKSTRAPVLDNITLRIPFGSSVGIVGPSGSGKSTLIGLLTGLYTPDTGEVRVQGSLLSEIDPVKYREKLAYVAQDSFLFSGSVRENILAGAPGADLAAVNEAVRCAHLSQIVSEMPMGLESPVGEFGAKVSGGQRQRIALARALIKRPQLLILDEATSSLDSESESAVTRSVAEFQCTQVIVSHRLSTVAKCDQIVVLQSGRVADTGTHAQLLGRNEFYRRCAESQGLVTRAQHAVATG